MHPKIRLNMLLALRIILWYEWRLSIYIFTNMLIILCFWLFFMETFYYAKLSINVLCKPAKYIFSLQTAFAFLNSRTFCSTWNRFSSKVVEDCQYFNHCHQHNSFQKSCIILFDNHLWHLLHALLVEGVAVAKEKEHLKKVLFAKNDFPDHHHQVQNNPSCHHPHRQWLWWSSAKENRPQGEQTAGQW